MKDNHPIDNLFQERLVSRKTTPPANAWSAIEGNIQEKRGARGFIFYLAIAASVSLVCAFTWSNLNESSDAERVTTELARIQREKPTVNSDYPSAFELSLPNHLQTTAIVADLKEKPFQAASSNEEMRFIADVERIEFNKTVASQHATFRTDLNLNMSSFITSPGVFEETSRNRFSLIKGIASMARGVNDGKKAISGIRKSKIEFINDDLKFGKTKEVEKVQATIDQDSPSNDQ